MSMLRSCWLPDGVDAAILTRKNPGDYPTVLFVAVRSEIPLGERNGSALSSFEVVETANGLVRIEKYGAGFKLEAPTTSCQTVMPGQLDPALVMTGKSIFLVWPADEHNMYFVGDAYKIRNAPGHDKGITWAFLMACTKYYL